MARKPLQKYKVNPIDPDVLRRLDVVNRGFSGYNTSNALSVLPRIFTPPAPGGPQLKYLVSSAPWIFPYFRIQH
jgi:hypothetical protein